MFTNVAQTTIDPDMKDLIWNIVIDLIYQASQADQAIIAPIINHLPMFAIADSPKYWHLFNPY